MFSRFKILYKIKARLKYAEKMGKEKKIEW